MFVFFIFLGWTSGALKMFKKYRVKKKKKYRVKLDSSQGEWLMEQLGNNEIDMMVFVFVFFFSFVIRKE